MLTTLFGTAERRAAFDPPVPAAEARRAILNGRAPANLRVAGTLDLSDEPRLTRLPAGLTCGHLNLSGCIGLQALPVDQRVRRLNLNGCTGLRDLPDGFRCYALSAQNTRLRALPADLQVDYLLDLTGCAELEALPAGLK